MNVVCLSFILTATIIYVAAASAVTDKYTQLQPGPGRERVASRFFSSLVGELSNMR